MGDLSPDVTDNALQVGSCNYSITLLVTFNPLVISVVIFYAIWNNADHALLDNFAFTLS